MARSTCSLSITLKVAGARQGQGEEEEELEVEGVLGGRCFNRAASRFIRVSISTTAPRSITKSTRARTVAGRRLADRWVEAEEEAVADGEEASAWTVGRGGARMVSIMCPTNIHPPCSRRPLSTTFTNSSSTTIIRRTTTSNSCRTGISAAVATEVAAAA